MSTPRLVREHLANLAFQRRDARIQICDHLLKLREHGRDYHWPLRKRMPLVARLCPEGARIASRPSRATKRCRSS